MAKKKATPPTKQMKEVVLKKFYRIMEYNLQKESLDREVDEYPDTYDENQFQYDYEEFSHNPSNYSGETINLNRLLPVLKELEPEFSKYEAVEFTWDVNDDGYRSHPRIVGYRLETEEEYTQRMVALEKEKQAKELKKAQKQAKVLERKRKQLETLQKELGH